MVKVSFDSEDRTQHIAQCEHQVESLNIKLDGT